jgi:hypothetical protein
MTRRAYSPSLGKWLEVEAVEVPGAPAPRRRRPKRSGAFIVLPLAKAAAEFTAMKCPTALVWIALQYERWRRKGDTIPLPTALLRSWGLNRFVWMRALTRIERAGLVHVDRHSGGAARVTFTSP